MLGGQAADRLLGADQGVGQGQGVERSEVELVLAGAALVVGAGDRNPRCHQLVGRRP